MKCSSKLRDQICSEIARGVLFGFDLLAEELANLKLIVVHPNQTVTKSNGPPQDPRCEIVDGKVKFVIDMPPMELPAGENLLQFYAGSRTLTEMTVAIEPDDGKFSGMFLPQVALPISVELGTIK